MVTLSKAGIVEGAHGKGGGYRLNRPPEDYRIGDILRVTEESLAPVACLENDAAPCSRAESCRTLAMWKKLDTMIAGFFDGITVRDLMQGDDDAGSYVI